MNSNTVVLYLKKGYVLFDEEDFDLISPYKWILDARGYAIATCPPKNKRIAMHRVILGLTKPNEIGDHKNHKINDNRRCNIRKATHADNARNRTPTGRSKYLGVSYQTCRFVSTKTGKPMVYQYIKAKIRVNNILLHIGTFDNEQDAALAYNEAAKKHFGEFANLNVL